MAKGKGKPAAPSAAPKANLKIISRTRRSSFERKCLSKSAKRLFAGCSSFVFKVVDKVEKKSREKVKKTDTNKGDNK